MPIPNIAAAFHNRTTPDIEKKALYPRQAKSESPLNHDPKQKKRPTTGLFDLIRADAASGDSKLASASALEAALSSPTKPSSSAADMLAYWKNVTKASQAEQESLAIRLNTVLKKVNMEGFKYASKATTWRAKIFWMIMLFVIAAIMSFEVYKCIKDYKQSPVTTKFTISTPPALEFPKVSICFGSAINHTYLQMHRDLMAVAIAFRSRDAVTKKSKTNGRRKRSAQWQLDDDEIMDILKMQTENHIERYKREEAVRDDFDEHESENLKRPRRDVVVAAKNRTEDGNRTESEHDAGMKAAKLRVQAMLQAPNISDVIYQFYQDVGYKVDETFLECSFSGYNKEHINCRDIVYPVVDANYYLCYVVELPEEMKQTVAGKGLKLVLNSHINLYPKDPEEKPSAYAGMLVSIDKEYNPFDWEKICITPGRLTKIDLAMTHVHLENLESGPLIQHCITRDQSADVFQIFKANYSRTTCQMDCLFQSHRNHCQCLMLVDRSQLKENVLNDTAFCSPEKYTECVAELPNVDEAQKSVNACLAHCHPPCESYRYDMRASYAKLHPPSYSHVQLPPDVSPKQLVDLRIAFSRLEYAELIQKPSASFADVVANVGGQINLWMGASLISLFEIIFMAVGFAVWSIYIKLRKKQPLEK